eukprot:TRINITY_DN4932_c0_g1_i2.p1 TRINITY_DN4932_c0_g1~~TRINITY_DN4932_c0_g1_i2.p1  ORF type:complete len:229 (-),score=44.80 TRINITY_DN4932_c0_g1_i2:89-775(-)
MNPSYQPNPYPSGPNHLVDVIPQQSIPPSIPPNWQGSQNNLPYPVGLEQSSSGSAPPMSPQLQHQQYGQNQSPYPGGTAPNPYSAPVPGPNSGYPGQQGPYQQQQPWMQQYASQNSQLRNWFDSVDQDRSGFVDANELRRALAAGGEDFSSATVDLMISMFDRDNNQNINFDEFSALFGFINQTRDAFNAFDQQKQGITLQDFASALQRVGFNFGPPPIFESFPWGLK